MKKCHVQDLRTVWELLDAIGTNLGYERSAAEGVADLRAELAVILLKVDPKFLQERMGPGIPTDQHSTPKCDPFWIKDVAKSALLGKEVGVWDS